ncbi:MBOAT family O-acyltransferase [Fusobacterium varium]|nr:MBOAT family protein [Fusobacterium varium]HBJ79637.1 membrane-bound O-acyltransferase family protein [Fusobacterium sp.]
MLFNSYEFIFLFLPITLIIYFTLNRYGKNNIAKGWLVVASLYFYSYFHLSYLYLILSSIIVNYFIGNKLNHKSLTGKERKIWMIIGVAFNLGLLGYFKYYDFFVENINIVLKTNFTLLHILLPLGISFFTFQQLSFIIDSYNEESMKYDFLSYCLFVTFFPQLIAGPIVLPNEMLPQFEDKRNKLINYENMNRGLYMFSIGLAKKVIIADTIANFANAGFDQMETLNIIEAWMTSISYTLQLYFDFSGYCDMAMGIALMFNIVLPLNFNSPYKSTNIQEFWKRWHMTLGRFMTNYLYIPLGGNRVGERKTLRNLFIVFMASGIWHGAGWNFVIWGCLHGICILIHRVWKNSGRKMNKLLGWFITINLVNIFWVFFRAETLNGALKVLKGMFNYKSLITVVLEMEQKNNLMRIYQEIKDIFGANEIDIAILLFATIITFLLNNTFNIVNSLKINIKNCFIVAFFFSISICYFNGISNFLYFNF